MRASISAWIEFSTSAAEIAGPLEPPDARPMTVSPETVMSVIVLELSKVTGTTATPLKQTDEVVLSQ